MTSVVRDRLRATALLLGMLTIAACSSGTASPSPDEAAAAPGTGTAPIAAGSDAGPNAPDAAVVLKDPAGCMADPRANAYTPGMTIASAGGKVKLTLVSTSLEPQIPGTNTWILRADDSTGLPLKSPSLTAKPWMPDHGHGTSIVATVTSQPDGSFQAAPLYFFMPGLWETIFAVTTADGISDKATFTFCVGSTT